MTRLFLRFYLAVIVILIAAWLIQAYVFRRTSIENNITVIEDALGGGARLARDELSVEAKEDFSQTIERLQSKFDFPIQVVQRAQVRLPLAMIQRIDAGEVVLNGSHLYLIFPEHERLLELGPLPRFAGPTQTDITIGLGSVFLLTALAIAILLRPLVTQLRSVEQTALAIADGDLSARIDTSGPKRSVPFAGAFNSMADRVQQLLRSQKELLQAVSHELRTPLTRIKFATELLHTATDQESRDKRLAAIDEATDQLDDLVGELLTYVRLDAETETGEGETFEIEPLIAESVGIYASLHPQKEFSISLADPVLSVSTYRRALLRALGNLLSNAGKYCHERVLVTATQEHSKLLIVVEDDGPGIGVQDRETVFEPFKRLTSNTQPGIGLGLALVRRICHRLGGEVSVSDSPLGGARFTITIPSEAVCTSESLD